MKAIILAAGEGVRMRPLTENTPKPLLSVGGKPILEHIVASLPDAVDKLIIVVGYLGDQIKKYCGNDFLGKQVHYVRQEKKLGTHHALSLCKPFIKKGERFFVLYADDIHGKEGLERCLEHERAMLVDRVEDPRKFGVVKLAHDGSVAEIVEKPEHPSSNLVSTGAMLLDSAIFDYEADIHPNGEYYLTSALEKMMKDGYAVFAVQATRWHPIGYPEDLKVAERAVNGTGTDMKVIGITGHPGSGKDTAADHLAKKGFRKVSLGDVLREKMRELGIPTDRTRIHEFVKQKRAQYGNSYPAEEVISAIDGNTVVVGFRNVEEIKRFREAYGKGFMLIAIETSLAVRYERAKQRNRHGDDVSLERFKEEELRERANDTGSHEVDRVMAAADVSLANDGPEEALFFALDHLE